MHEPGKASNVFRRALDESHWADFARSLFFVQGSFNDTRAYAQLKVKLDALDQQFGIPGSRVFYLAVPPQVVHLCVQHLKEAGMVRDAAEQTAFTRVIVEKPIGRDLNSAREVIRVVGATFAESQTYRIDHYLGKETVQNLLVLRFANSIFEPLWNEKHIDHVQITVAEEEGLAQYDADTGQMTSTRAAITKESAPARHAAKPHASGALHGGHGASLVARARSSARCQSRRANCLRQLTPTTWTRSWCAANTSRERCMGERVPGYRKEVRNSFESMDKELLPGSVNSTTDTFVACKLFVDNWRWAGVPFYLRTGKRLPKRVSEVAIQFKDVPQVLFNSHPATPLEPTVLSVRVQPEEGLSMRIASKLPGPKIRIYPVKMEFNYSSSFGNKSPEAYERLLLDVMAGDATLFMRRDQVEAAWKFVMPILDRWEQTHVRDLPEYQCGTWGPVEADRIIEADGRRWRNV